MVAKRRCICRNHGGICVFIFTATLLFCSSYMFGAAEEPAKQTDQLSEPNKSDSSKSARYRIFSLKNISTKKAKEYLSELEIGTVSELPSPNTLLVTASSHELIKAGAVLKLVDTNEPFVVKPIFLASQTAKLPSNEQIALAVGDISIGTFLEPPPGQNKSKAIIDVHNDAVLIVAPADKVDQIVAAIMKLQNAKKQGDTSLPNEPNKTAEPNRISEPNNKTPAESAASSPASLPNDVESEELFGKALNSLAQADKQLAEIEVRVDSTKAKKETSEKQAEQLKEWEDEEEAAYDANNLQAVAAGSEDSNQSVSKSNQYVPAPTALADEELELNLPEKLNIIDLLDLVGKYLKLDIMYDPTVITGEVVLRVQGPIKVKNLYPYAESILKFKRFVMTRNGNLVTIVPAANVMDVDPTWITDEGRVQYGDVIVTRPFNLKYIDATSAKALLDGMKLGANSTPLPDGGTLIVTEFANRMGRIEELLALIDKPGEPKKFKFRQLKYTMASTMAPKIKSLMEQMGNISITVAAKEPGQAPPGAPVRGRRITQPQPQPQPAQPGQQAQSNIPAVYLDFDERTNRILMIGLENELKIVDSLVDTLDVVQQDLRTLRLYEIQHVGAEEVKIKLAEIGIISSAGETKRTTRDTSRPGQPPTQPQPGQPTPSTTAATEALTEEPQVVIIEATNSLLVNATPEQHAQIAMIIGYVDSEQLQAAIDYRVYPLENQDPEKLAAVLTKLIQETTETKDEKGAKIQTTTVKKTDEDIIIVPDPKTYSLIVYANKKNQVWISALIKSLDDYRPQVLLDATLVEITKTDEFKLDLDLVTKLPAMTPGGTMQKLAANVLLTPFPSNIVQEAASTHGAGGTAFYADSHIQALLTAIQSKNYGRIMARPKLLVNDNEKGTIKTQQTQTIVSPLVTILPGSVGGSAPTASTSVQMQSYQSGVTLDIQPHISKGDQLQLKITLTRIDAIKQADYSIQASGTALTGPTPPNLVSTDVTTLVTVPDNMTIILGGLEKLDQSKKGAKIPFLGDVPLVGGLFKNTNNSDTQDRLYVFLKAHIIRPGDKVTGESKIKVISLKNRAEFEKHEKEMQDAQDWAGVKAKPMDPNTVLEEY